MFGRNFYIALGNLIYSVYYGNLLYKELPQKELFRLIKKYITPNEDGDDEFGTNNSFYCIFEIERLMDDHTDPYDAFRVFEQYYSTNCKVFNRRIQLEIDELLNSLMNHNGGMHSDYFFIKYQELTSSKARQANMS